MIYIACDHGGLELKGAIIREFGKTEEIIDLGTDSTQSVDYPDYGIKCAQAVADSCGSARGIVICKTGVGMSICANKVKGVRCALCTSPDMARLCREHNNANMLALGAGNTDIPTALNMVKLFLSTEFAAGRHTARVDKITEYEKHNG